MSAYLFRFLPSFKRASFRNSLTLLAATMAMGACLESPADDIARWTFDTLPSGTFATGISPGPITANVGAGTATGLHSSPTTVWSGAVGNGSIRSLSSNWWSLGDYVQFNFSTVGYSNLNFTWDELQFGSNVSSLMLPFYSTDGTNFTPISSGYPVAQGVWNSNTISAGFTNILDLSSVAALQGQANVYIRLLYFGSISVLPPTAQLRFDNVVATGTPPIGPGIRDWINASGGQFATSTNWSPALVPGANDDAYFEIGQATYTTAFSTNAASKSLKVSGDQVTLNLNGYTYTTSDSTVNSVIVQNESTSFNAKLRVTVGNLVARGVFVDSVAGAQSSLEVVGNGAQLHRSGATSDVQLGSVGRGTLLVDDYGYLEADRLLIGEASSAFNDTSGAATISNHGHVLVSGAARFGANGGDSDLKILSGGWFETGGTLGAESTIGVGAGGTNKVLVSGTNSRWTAAGYLYVGQAGSGELSIEDGGAVSSPYAQVGGLVGGAGKLTITGSGSSWTVDQDMYLSGYSLDDGAANVTVQQGGTLYVERRLEMSPNSQINVNFPTGLISIGNATNTTALAGNVYVGNNGVLAGTGYLHAGGGVIVQSGGIVDLRDDVLATCNMDASYRQEAGSTLKIEVSSSGADQLHAINAIVAGNLEVTLRGGLTPSHGAEFLVLTTNLGVTGGFANLNSQHRIMTTGGEGSFFVGVGGGSSYIFLSAFSPAGDFNLDGVVGAADYVVWRKGLGTTYTQNDYTIWRSNFGKTAGSAAGFAAGTSSVPEPASALMMLYASIWFAGGYRRRTHSVVSN